MTSITVEQRLYCNTRVTSRGCLEYTRCQLPSGHGQIHYKGKTVLAHRLSWELANGPIPEGLCVLHDCDNPPCINPEHLFLGTRVDNNLDRDSKGRGRTNGYELKTHCINEHEYTKENTYIYPDGSRSCKKCHRERNNAWMRSHR